jgi:hypothetical protein
LKGSSEGRVIFGRTLLFGHVSTERRSYFANKLGATSRRFSREIQASNGNLRDVFTEKFYKEYLE